jgi:telomerase Cajal body protein 1
MTTTSSSPQQASTTTVAKDPRCFAESTDILGHDNFPQGCSFSPDGLCIATATAADATLRLYNTQVSTDHNYNCDNDESVQQPQPWKTALASTVVGEVVRSYDWYPPMQSTQPATCCLIATGRDQPVQLIDAYTGGTRATYVPMNSMDEMESPTVIRFSPHNGSHIVTAGFKTQRMIQLFDSARPGKQALACLLLGQTKRSSDGQKGIVSSLAFSKADPMLLAVGTYAPGSIYLYDFRQGTQQPSGTIWNGTCIVGHGKKHASKKRRINATNNNNDNDDDTASFFSAAKTLWYAHRAQRGITQLEFDASGKLYSASRHADAILVWDVRMLSSREEYSNQPIRGYTSYDLNAQTNQRLQFALDDASSRLWVGGLPTSNDQMPTVRVYDTNESSNNNHNDDKLLQQLSIEGCAPRDAVNGVSYNAAYDMLAVATGSRRFPSEADYEETTDDVGDLVSNSKDTLPPGSLRLYKWNTSATQ